MARRAERKKRREERAAALAEKRAAEAALRARLKQEKEDRERDWAERLAALKQEQEQADAEAADRAQRHAAIKNADVVADAETEDRKRRRAQLKLDEARGREEGVARIQARPGLLKELKEEEEQAAVEQAARDERLADIEEEKATGKKKQVVEKVEEEQKILSADELPEDMAHMSDEQAAAARLAKSQNRGQVLTTLNEMRAGEHSAAETIQIAARNRAEARRRHHEEDNDMLKMMSNALFTGRQDTDGGFMSFGRSRRPSIGGRGAADSREMTAALVRIRELENEEKALHGKLEASEANEQAAADRILQLEALLADTRSRLEALENEKQWRKQEMARRSAAPSLLEQRENRGARPTFVEEAAAQTLQAGARGRLGRKDGEAHRRVANVSSTLGLIVKPKPRRASETFAPTDPALPKDVETIAKSQGGSLLNRMEALANKRRRSLGVCSKRAPITQPGTKSNRDTSTPREEPRSERAGTQRV